MSDSPPTQYVITKAQRLLSPDLSACLLKHFTEAQLWMLVEEWERILPYGVIKIVAHDGKPKIIRAEVSKTLPKDNR